MQPDVLVTGIGIVSPAGCGTEKTWSSLLAGELAVGPARQGDAVTSPVGGVDLEGCRTTFAGQIRDFTPPEGTEKYDRVCQLAIAAAEEALTSAGLSTGQPALDQAKISIGTSKGGILSFARIADHFLRNHPETTINPSELSNLLMDIPPDAPARRIADRFDVNGGIHSSVSACTTGAHAIIRAAQLIADGDADLVLCGAADASLHPLWFGAFERMGVLAAEHPSRGPAWACQPFDRNRDGFAIGEGAAVLILESSASVRRRHSQPIARMAGWAVGSDPTSLIQLDLEGTSLAHVIQQACGQAELIPSQIACIHAHGTATQSNDLIEIRAIRQVLGKSADQVPVVSVKGNIGHLLGAASAVETALAILTCRDRISPGNATLLDPDPKLGQAYLPTKTVKIAAGAVLKTSLGFGGHLAAILITPP